jgi:hypothetical protein
VTAATNEAAASQMSEPAKILELHFQACDMGLSMRRLWEHTELGQLNVFGKAISSRPELNHASAFIDVVRIEDDAWSLAGFTLADLRGGKVPAGSMAIEQAAFLECLDTPEATAFIAMVAEHIALCSIRQATRNQHHQFLPPAQADDVFGVPLIFSTLRQRLKDMGHAKARTEQWLRTIENFQKKGLRAEEFERSQLMPELEVLDDDGGDQVLAFELVALCNFEALRLSVMPVVSDAQRQLRFSSAPSRTLKRTKKLPKAQDGQARDVVGFDPVLGYRIEQVEHQTLWGPEHHWQAVTFDGSVIRNVAKQTLLSTSESAAALAASHAKQHFPKRMALGRWRHYAWTGGKDYTEWLITLPYYPASFFSSHFSIRNVLAHVRCDVREGADGERVLLLHEVQSDWAQSARRDINCGDMEIGDDACPPFLKEWPALVMKLILLHAASRGLDAVTWTRGAHQVFRFKGLGATGLNALYDRTLPREINRILKPFGVVCEMLGVFVPTNFAIKQSENGYEVYTAENVLLATAPTLEDAQQFVPDDAHELLYEVHGVRLTDTIRKAILSKGFPAWG